MKYYKVHGISFKGQVWDSELRIDDAGYHSYKIGYTTFPILKWFNRLDDNWLRVNPNGECPYHSSVIKDTIFEPVKWYYSLPKTYKKVHCTYEDGQVRTATLRINGDKQLAINIAVSLGGIIKIENILSHWCEVYPDGTFFKGVKDLHTEVELIHWNYI